MSLFVACVGGPMEQVRRWRDEVLAHLSLPHTLICLTDDPDGCEGVTCVDITELRLPGPWAKMVLFDQQWRGRSKIIFLDLDIRIKGDLAPLARVPGEFAICAGEGGEYDARVMVIGGGMAGFVWTAFDTRRDEMMRQHKTPAAALAAIYPGAARLKGVPVELQQVQRS